MDIVVPDLAESVKEGDIGGWLVDDGSVVKKDDLILELETDKATVELAAEASGRIEILVQAGESVSVGDVVGRIHEGETAAEAGEPSEPDAAVEEPAEGDGAEPEEAEEGRPEESPARAEKAGENGAKRAEKTEPRKPEKPAKPAKPEKPAPEPAARGTAPAERVTTKEVRAGDGAGAAEGEEPGVRRVRMTRLRRRIAERLVEAQRTAAILTTFNEIDMSGVLELRREHQARFEERHGVRLGFMSLFARASILALEEFPELNASIEDDEIVYHDFVHLGIAVGTERGLVVPVVRDAHRLSFAEIERRIKELASEARDGDLSIEDLQGGTFTISNGGIYGSLMSTPILNPPQSGILGMHKIEKRAVVIEDESAGEERIESRPMMYVALSYDHRIVDGEQAVTFLVRVKERLEDPTRLLLDA